MAKSTAKRVDTPPFEVLRDTSEKMGWHFPNLTVEDANLYTGDYTLKGLEDKFTIERKASTSEIANNIKEDRFFDELGRLKKFKHAFIVCEFSMNDVHIFPRNSGIPHYIWPKLKITAASLLKEMVEIMIKYEVPILFCDNVDGARKAALSIFKRMAEKYL